MAFYHHRPSRQTLIITQNRSRDASFFQHAPTPPLSTNLYMQDLYQYNKPLKQRNPLTHAKVEILQSVKKFYIWAALLFSTLPAIELSTWAIFRPGLTCVVFLNVAERLRLSRRQLAGIGQAYRIAGHS
ncbi:MAG: hypothetical protein ACFCUT_13215 [Kiloniellaceae bacterium]